MIKERPAVNVLGAVFAGVLFSQFLRLAPDPNSLPEAVACCIFASAMVVFLIWYNSDQ